MKKLYIVIALTILLNGCGWMITMKNNTVEEIKFQCGKQCKTFALTQHQSKLNIKQKKHLKNLAKHTKKTILISACNDKSKPLATNIYNYIVTHTNKQAAIVNNTLPFNNNYSICANIVYGPISVLLPNCHKKNNKLNNLINHNFGCHSHYNLIKMVEDPNDFFIKSVNNGIK